MAEPTTVLLVEDDELLREGLGDYLGLSGFRVTAVADSLSFRSRFTEGGWDVAVIDLGLPDGPGEELVRSVRGEAGTSTAIVVITARDTLETRLACYRLGADLFLGKPIEGRALAAALAGLAAFRSLAGTAAPR